MAQAFHIDGPCAIYLGIGSGTPASLSLLGLAEDGIDVQVDQRYTDVKCDSGGPEVPVDLQRMGRTANISGNVVMYDLATLQAARQGGGVADGVEPALGALIGQEISAAWAGGAYRLVIASADEVFRFYNCILRGPQGLKAGVPYKRQRLNWFSWVYVPAGTLTAAGRYLYDHTNA